MDLYDDSRTLIHSGTLARRQRSEIDWHGWNDYVVALLDNYRKCCSTYQPLLRLTNSSVVLTRAETRSSGNVKHVVVSRVSVTCEVDAIFGINVWSRAS